MRKYRVGIIGTGNVAAAHARAYLGLGMKITASCDIDAAKLYKFKENHRVERTYTDYAEMLEKERLDLVSVCTWPSLHCEMTLAAAEFGVKGILCEKPIALTLKDADTMISACEKAGSKLAVAHIRRYSGEYVFARKLLASGAIGEMAFIHGAAVGDMLSDGTHLVDLAFFLAGDPDAEWVIGQVDLYEKRRRYGHPVEDAAIGYFKLSNGIRVFVETSQITGTQVPVGQFGFSSESMFKNLDRAKRINWWSRGITYCSFHVSGSDGMLEVGEWNKPKLKYRGKGTDKWETPSIPQNDPFVEIVKDLVKSVDEDRQPLSNGFQARKALEILIAIFESARLRETVTLPLKVDYNPLFKLSGVDG